MTTRLQLYRAKMRAAQAEQKQWLKHYTRAYRAMVKLGERMTILDGKIAAEEAKTVAQRARQEVHGNFAREA